MLDRCDVRRKMYDVRQLFIARTIVHRTPNIVHLTSHLTSLVFTFAIPPAKFKQGGKPLYHWLHQQQIGNLFLNAFVARKNPNRGK
jgi:hypothetical protein